MNQFDNCERIAYTNILAIGVNVLVGHFIVHKLLITFDLYSAPVIFTQFTMIFVWFVSVNSVSGSKSFQLEIWNFLNKFGDQ